MAHPYPIPNSNLASQIRNNLKKTIKQLVQEQVEKSINMEKYSCRDHSTDEAAKAFSDMVVSRNKRIDELEQLVGEKNVQIDKLTKHVKQLNETLYTRNNTIQYLTKENLEYSDEIHKLRNRKTESKLNNYFKNMFYIDRYEMHDTIKLKHPKRYKTIIYLRYFLSFSPFFMVFFFPFWVGVFLCCIWAILNQYLERYQNNLHNSILKDKSNTLPGGPFDITREMIWAKDEDVVKAKFELLSTTYPEYLKNEL